MIDQSEILSHSQVQFITLFLKVHNCVAPLPATASCTNLVQKNQFPDLPTNFDFFTINFTVWSHLLSTGGDALTSSQKNTLILIGMKNSDSHLKIPDLAS
jgi:hypothetical protein